MTAQTAVQAILELQAEHGFDASQVDHVTVAGDQRMATINNIPNPTDIMIAQYSIPFCVALALFRDPRDPASFDQSALIVTIRLHDGSELARAVDEFDGTPNRPLDQAALRDKFTMLMARPDDEAARTFHRLQNLENEADLQWIGAHDE
jgi:2-methylcitrate dehydratase PrpD